ncbi:hypothetical protein UY3_12817 [Chelonia mydas]|uniref:Uncharacterized protein n=1 Tax=Chelonia mydas TaxID=8469 RepID=M7BPF4_CHEMY|nr:hypothetical protein UY3_12817 [Chelonia mydas]
MGAAGSGGQYVPRPTLLPAALIGLEQQTAATGSRDRPNLRTQQSSSFHFNKISNHWLSKVLAEELPEPPRETNDWMLPSIQQD